MNLRKPYLRKIRELGYRFCKQKKRVLLYRKSTPVRYIMVPRSKLLSEGYIRLNLRREGLSESEIDDFVESTRAH